MRVIFLYFLLTFCTIQVIYAQQYTVSGQILNDRTQFPVDYATISLANNELWCSSDDKGNFVLKNIPAGKATIVISSFGFESKQYTITIDRNITGLKIRLKEKSLALNEVVVTAQEGKGMANSYVIDRTALDHLQMMNVIDVSSLLPGGKTKSESKPSLAAERFFVNGRSGENGNPSFGTAVEVDGVRLSNNAARDLGSSDIGGVDTRNLSTTNIESVEIITGVPSVEYGDLSNGMVKINSKKGKTPYVLDMATRPHSKQIALSKGFDLMKNRGVLNLSYEYTRSIQDLASPYTSYDRNGISLNYSNTVNRSSGQPILLNIGLAGNLGGYDSKSDPDRFVNTYTKQRDNTYRANVSAKWSLKKSWITNLEMLGSVNYTDRLRTSNDNDDTGTSRISIRTKEEGYHIGQTYAENPDAAIILIPPGYWYVLSYLDSKPLNTAAKLKADWVRKFGKVNNKIMLGVEFNRNQNEGKGRYYNDIRYAPTWREYKYSDEPALNNYAIYAENQATIPINDTRLILMAGVRSDITSIGGSEYGTVNSLSPRFNAKYLFWQGKKDALIRDFQVRVGWGKAVKLPPFAALYPLPSYSDYPTFTGKSNAQAEAVYAYYTMPSTRMYNKDLKWQYDTQTSIGVDFTIKGIKVTLNASIDKTKNPYTSTNMYNPFSYNFTGQTDIDKSAIPLSDQVYSVDKNTGIVTVTDKTGALPSEVLNHTTRYTFKNNTMYVNGSSVDRKSFSWIVDFGKIQALQTSIRWDGNYYYYKSIDQTITQGLSMQNAATNTDPKKYVAYYVGSGGGTANGKETKSLNSNLTFVTHIPAIKMIVSLRIEASLYNYTQNLSEYDGKTLAFNIDNKDDAFPSTTNQNIYTASGYTAIYPLYYTSYSDPNTKIPFAEKFAWAKDNDAALYNELSRMVNKSGYKGTFNKSTLSAYYSANINVTKEIGRFVSISFNAVNFLNTLQQIKDSSDDRDISLYGSGYVPSFYYGLSLRIKL